MEKLYKIPKTIGDKWLKALDSGKYKQGSGELCDTSIPGHAYCCIGVLGRACGLDDSTMSGISFVESVAEIGDSNYERERRLTLYDKATTLGFPRELLYTGMGSQEHKSFARVLANMNDRENCTFKDIAQWIRENVEFYEREEI